MPHERRSARPARLCFVPGRVAGPAGPSAYSAGLYLAAPATPKSATRPYAIVRNMSNTPAVAIEGLGFAYNGAPALRDVTFSVERGEIYGLLGPNGGGKTTLFRILSTLLPPQEGAAAIFGTDVGQQPTAVRKSIGVVFQNQSLDRLLTARENLQHQGHLYGLRGAPLAARIDELLDRFGLGDRKQDVVNTLSGGLRRRLELAKGLLHGPDLLLLDEPSTGVDPAARLQFWEYLRRLRDDENLTVLLTTHLLEEADKCDRLGVLDRGSLVAEGTPDQLKSRIGGEMVSLTGDDAEALAEGLSTQLGVNAQVVDRTVRFEHPRGSQLVARLMENSQGRIQSVTVSKPTLEDVFIRMTGRRFTEDSPPEPS